MIHTPFHSSLAIAMTVSPVLANASEFCVFIPGGSADPVRTADPQSGESLGKTEHLQAVNGLAGHPHSKYVVAGSYAEVDREAVAGSRPTNVCEDEHAAHHARSQTRVGPEDAGNVESTRAQVGRRFLRTAQEARESNAIGLGPDIGRAAHALEEELDLTIAGRLQTARNPYESGPDT